MTAQLLDLRLPIEREHGKTGVFVLPAPFLVDRLLDGLRPVEPVTRFLQARAEHRGVQGLDDAQLGLGQRPDRFALLRQFVDRGAGLPGGGELSFQVRQPAFQVVERPGASTRLTDPVHALLAKPVQHALRGPVRVRGIGQGDDHFLDAARIFEAHHLAAGDAGGIRVDVTADAQQLPPKLDCTRGVPLEAVGKVGAGADIGDTGGFRIEISLNPELGSIVEREFQRQPEVATLPWSPAIGSLDCGGAGPVARAQAKQAGHDRFLQGGFARLVRSDDQVHGGTET